MKRKMGGMDLTYLGHDEQGRLLLCPSDQESVEKVRLGYMCGSCGEPFKVYTVRCPVCHTARDLEQDLAALPEDWAPTKGD